MNFVKLLIHCIKMHNYQLSKLEKEIKNTLFAFSCYFICIFIVLWYLNVISSQSDVIIFIFMYIFNLCVITLSYITMKVRILNTAIVYHLQTNKWYANMV